MIFLGPQDFPVTGQSYSFHKTFDIYTGKKAKLCYPSKDSKYLVLKTLWFFIRLFCCSLQNKNLFYLTISRSRFGFYRDFIIFFISRIFNRRLLIHLHGADFKTFFLKSSHMDKYFINYMYQRIEFGIVLLDEMKDQFEDFPNIHCFVLPNFHLIDISLEQVRKKAEYFKNAEHLKCIFLSNIMDEKGIWESISAAKKCIDNKVPVSLDIVGQVLGDEKKVDSYLSTLSDTTEKYSQIRFFGALYGEEKNRQLCQADIFILPTYYPTEALPISALEAMAAGLIILITNHNYLGNVFSEKSGQMLTPESSDSIYEALTEINKNKEHYSEMMIKNSIRAAEDFSLKRYEVGFHFIISNVASSRVYQ